jgi:YgiT-type zinc finger domain-containing protein
MQCVICKHGHTRPAQVTITLERNGTTLVFKGVPADVCAICAEQYIDEQTTQSGRLRPVSRSKSVPSLWRELSVSNPRGGY